MDENKEAVIEQTEEAAQPEAAPIAEPVAEAAPETKFCKYCGKKIAATAAFCAECGGNQNAAPAPAPAPVAAPAPAPASAPVVYGPALKFSTRRGLAKMFFLGILTCGIYNIVIMSRIADEINIAASRYDGQKTAPYLVSFILSVFTLGIYPIVWIHKLCNRIGDELKRRGIDYKFSAAHFWLWNVLGSLILVGPFIYLHKFMKAMNLINGDYNIKG
ncbi:MAG: DUF4234 domain-containing protein [Clostridia bacterium]|nr:DUF4234 domain-containing protein [Clostridia bacterium]